jgi:hypothetical protein
MSESSEVNYIDPEAVRQRASEIGIRDPKLFWIARESLSAPIPDGWEEATTDEGYKYYYNVASNESSWEHPSLGNFMTINQSSIEMTNVKHYIFEGYYRQLHEQYARGGPKSETYESSEADYYAQQASGIEPEQMTDNGGYSERFEAAIEPNYTNDMNNTNTNQDRTPSRPPPSTSYSNASNSALTTPITSARTTMSGYDANNESLLSPSSKASPPRKALAKLNEDSTGEDGEFGGEEKISAPVTGSAPGEPKNLFRTKQYYNLWQARYDALYVEVQ